MNLKARFSFLALAIVGLFLLAACGGETAPSASTSHTVDASPNQNAYQQTAIAVPVGQQVTVTFRNPGNVQHNWVLVNGGQDVANQVDEEGIAAGPPNYVPENGNVIAASSMLGQGGEEAITFTIDSPGEYLYICTFPGHYAAGMVGTLTAQQ